MDCPTNTVVIVGGGLSGLAAAVQLGRFGLPALLFDDSTEMGGRAKTECRDGFHLNYGPHRLYEMGPAARTFRELGVPINSATRGPNGGFAVLRGGRYTLPVGFCSLLTTGLLGAWAKRELARLLTSMSKVDIDALNCISIGRWLQVNVHDPDVIQLVHAFVRYATYCDDPEHQSASAAIAQLRLSIGSPVLYIHHGWGSMVAGLQKAATSSGSEIIRGRRVVAVNAAGEYATSVTLADGSLVTARAVIVATSPQSARQLLCGRAAVDVPPTPVRVAALDVALRRLPRERAVFALGIDEPWSFSADSVIARVAPENGAVVHVAKYLRGGAATASDERQLERALDLLQPGWRDLIVYRRFLPTAVVSHALVAAESGGFAGRPSGRVPGLKNVFLAGDWIGRTGQLADASVASGIEAARTIAQISCSRYGL
ncbi:MAG TPA: FAD-dependent oxidoreductase [Vicinamibacterales bacterium]|jgi:phytoene dehydrogenase-like protein